MKKSGCGCGCIGHFFFFSFLLGIVSHVFIVPDQPVTLLFSVALTGYIYWLIANRMGWLKKEAVLPDEQSSSREIDSIDDDFHSEFISLCRSDLVEFNYVDNSGEVTKRKVEVDKIRKKYHFAGYCHLRKEPRTFKFQGIQGKVVRVSTGEVLNKNDWLIELQELIK